MAVALSPCIVEAGEGRILIVGPHDARVIMSSADTGGEYSLFEMVTPPGAGPPAHIHTREDETYYVLEGEMEITVAGTTRRVGPGATAFGPRGVAHAFRNPGQTTMRMLVMTTPGGLERFFEEVHAKLGREMNADLFAQIVVRHGMRLLA